MDAVRNNGLALQFLSDEFRNDEDIVYLAVENNPMALLWASSGQKNNYEIVYTAVR